MIGFESPSSTKLFYHFNLEKKVRPNHPLRKLKEILNLDFMYGLLKDRYGTNGNVSVPPPVIMKMMVLLFLYNVRSERELMETIPERLDWLWFLGYDIDGEVPDHSVLSKARKRWGEDIFKELFNRVVRQAVDAGLVDGEKIFVDSSLVEADASRNSVRSRKELDLDDKYRELLKRLDERGEEGLGEHGKVNREHISATDPDATITKRKGEAKLYYQVHRGVDGKQEIITSCTVSTGAVNEAHRLPEVIAGHEAATGAEVKVAVADSKYGTKENFIGLKKQGITTHLKNLAQSSGKRGAIFGKERFVYDPERDVFICPQGNELRKRSSNAARNWTEYKASKSACRECPLRSHCTRDRNGRTVKKEPDEEYLSAAREDAGSEMAMADLKTRQHLMERSFAIGKRYGYKRARWRGTWRVSIQQLLVAVVQNLKKIARHGIDGPMAETRPLPQSTMSCTVAAKFKTLMAALCYFITSREAPCYTV